VLDTTYFFAASILRAKGRGARTTVRWSCPVYPVKVLDNSGAP
jgi:hypothetical protein